MGLEVLILILLCLAAGMGYSYRSGIKSGRVQGIVASLDHLIEEGHLNVLDADEAEDAI